MRAVWSSNLVLIKSDTGCQRFATASTLTARKYCSCVALMLSREDCPANSLHVRFDVIINSLALYTQRVAWKDWFGRRLQKWVIIDVACFIFKKYELKNTASRLRFLLSNLQFLWWYITFTVKGDEKKRHWWERASRTFVWLVVYW